MQSKNKNFKISIIIVYYGGRENLLELLKSIKNNNYRASYEIILVNNKLDEDIGTIIKKRSNVRYYKSPGNIGYGRGNNYGATHARGKYILIVNPDVILKPKSLDAMANFLSEKKEVAIVGPNFIDKSGNLLKLQGTAELTPLRAIFSLSFINRIFPNNRFSQEYNLTKLNKKSIREVDVVSGSCFMIRTDVFKKLGGFDKRFFLYFEESDLCKRVKDSGRKIYMIPDAEVFHDWEPGEGGVKLRKYFEQSRFYYFRKHFGIILALFVELFTRISKYSISLFLILILGGILRFWKLKQLMPFIGDFGWYYLQARDVLTNHYLPLVGITSSVPILHQGVFWTYLLTLALWFGNFAPISGAILSCFLGLVGVWGTYMVTSALISKRVAIIASLIAASFNYIVFLDRAPFQTAAIFPATLALFWFANSGRKKEGSTSIFIAGVLWGLLFQLELAAFIFIPIFWISYWLKDVRISVAKVVSFAAGAFWGIAPFIIYDFKNGTFIQTLGFMVWFFTKIYDRLIFFSIAVLLFLLVWNLITKFNKFSFPLIFIFVWAVMGAGAFYVKGNFADAYLPLIYFPFIFLVSIFFDIIIRNLGRVGWILFGLIIFFNLVRYRVTINNPALFDSGLARQEQVARFIVEKGSGEDFNFVYLGPGVQYESGGANWEYLLWVNGAKMSKDAKQEYAIIQKPYVGLAGFVPLQSFGQIVVATKDEN
jgi:GT2 family glycosyltransferase